MKNILFALLIATLITGCARIDPFSPRQKQTIQNQDGKIEELKSNANGVQLELLKLKQQTEINARDIDRTQTGMFNKQNTGVQIFQGDGAILAVIILAGMIMATLIVYYRNRAQKGEKSTEILASQIVSQNNPDLEDAVFMAAQHTEVESDIYKAIVKRKRR